MPLMTDGDRLVSARRVHQKEVIPRPFKEKASPQQTLEGETVRAKKIETQQPNRANPNQDEDTLEDNIETLPHPGRETALRQVAEKSWGKKKTTPLKPS